MKEKLKELLHRRKKSSERSSPRASYEQSESSSPRSPRTVQHSASHANEPHQAGRSPPTSSGLGDGRASHDADRVSHSTAPKTSGVNHAKSDPTELSGSIADDYRSYLPVLSPVEDANDEKELGSDRRPIGQGDDYHQENVADRNIDRNRSSLDGGRSKPLPEIPAPLNTGRNARHKPPTNTDPVRSTNRKVLSATSHGKHHDNVLVDRTRSHKETDTNGFSVRPVDNNTQSNQHGRRPQDEELLTSSSQGLGSRQDMAVKAPTDAAHNEQRVIGSGKDWKKQQQSMLEGAVDLKDSVDTDTHVQVAPTVVYEVVKPHEHEIVQRKVYREIHNYTHYHRLQPVLQTEVLPPRHFIPNPNSEGLIEISADELPARTGENRWWEIVQKEPQYPDSIYQWRTEPEVVEGKPYITDEGFERRETTIIYPPTLADLSGYNGMVQPVHFDHKTGKRWMGALTTMDKLKQEISSAAEGDFMTMKEVTTDLPDVPSSPSVKRKPVDSEFV